MKSRKVSLFTMALSIVAILVLLGAATWAWLSEEQHMTTGSKIVTPHTLAITAANRESVANIDVGNIDVEEDGVSKYEVPFAVTGKPSFAYKLQLAHTTNIGFEYSIYKSTLHEGHTDDSDGCIKYTSPETGESFYYLKGKLFMDKSNYLTVPSSYSYSDNAGGTEYTTVQTMAKPKYMQNILHQDNGTGEFIHYYILSIEWTNAIKNDKETDVIYLTAEFFGG